MELGHIPGHHRTNSAAAGKDKVGDPYLPLQLFPMKGIAMRIVEKKILQLAQDRQLGRACFPIEKESQETKKQNNPCQAPRTNDLFCCHLCGNHLKRKHP